MIAQCVATAGAARATVGRDGPTWRATACGIAARRRPTAVPWAGARRRCRTGRILSERERRGPVGVAHGPAMGGRADVRRGNALVLTVQGAQLLEWKLRPSYIVGYHCQPQW